MQHEIVEIDMQQHHMTDRAILVSDDGEEENAVWLPLSQVEVKRKKNGIVLVTMPEWLAIEKRLV